MRFSAPLQAKPEAHPASCTKGKGALPVVKRPVGVVDHPTPSRAEVNERVKLYLYTSPHAFRACYMMNFTHAESVRLFNLFQVHY
jgi:hypothetical protein